MSEGFAVRNPNGTIDLHPHPGQWQAWKSERRFVAVLAGTQGGKTSFGPFWTQREIQRCGPGDYMMVTPTYPLLNLKALPEFLRLFEDWLGLGTYKTADRVFLVSKRGEQKLFGYEPINVPETRVIFGYAAEPESLESATAKAAWLDEPGQKRFKLGSWEAILRRLSLHQGRALLTTTLYNLGWLKQLIWDRWLAGDPEIDVVRFESIMNPAFPREEFERARATLPRWKFDLYYRAVFTRPAGLIYDNFDDRLHRCPRFRIPDEWDRFLGLDFGGVNTAGVFYAREPGTNRLYLYRTYKAGGRTAAGHAAALIDGEPQVPLCVGGSPSEGQWRDEFRAAGLPVREPAVKEVEVGIDRVYGAHAEGQIIVFDDLAEYLDEKLSYSRDVDEAGNVLETIEDKNSFHFCFVAGTQIQTEYGPMPIESVLPGMRVLTRSGYCPVAVATRRKAQTVRRVLFSDGRELVGTPDHPVWVSGLGFSAIDALRYGDIIETLEQMSHKGSQCDAKPSNFSESPTIATPMPNGRATVSISNIAGFSFIARSGSIILGLFRPITMFITKIWTRATMTPPTLRFCPGADTGNITVLAPGPQGSMSTGGKFNTRRPRGIAQKRAAHGIINTPSASTNSLFRPIASVNSAARHIRSNGTAPWIASVQTPAGRPTGELAGWMTSRASVHGVGNPSRSTNTAKNGIAPVHVLDVQDAGKATVYNLTVANRHEYFANGVLVSNCDAERYIIGWLREPVPESRLVEY